VPATQSFRARAAGGGWHAHQGGQQQGLDESDAEEAATDGSRTKNLAEKIEALREKRGRYGVLLTELERSGEYR
jgi:hypothetical protein